LAVIPPVLAANTPELVGINAGKFPEEVKLPLLEAVYG
jgi:hypothetical protein